jgi:hypothetical protein
MTKPSLLIATLLSAVASGVAAQSVSTTANSDYAFCANRPDRPEIVENMPFREAHRGILIQRMYTANAMTAVVENDDCSCETRFPAWDDTVEQYLELYAGIEDRHEIRSLTSGFTRSINDLRKLARPTCVEVGNW